MIQLIHTMKHKSFRNARISKTEITPDPPGLQDPPLGNQTHQRATKQVLAIFFFLSELLD